MSITQPWYSLPSTLFIIMVPRACRLPFSCICLSRCSIWFSTLWFPACGWVTVCCCTLCKRRGFNLCVAVVYITLWYWGGYVGLDWFWVGDFIIVWRLSIATVRATDLSGKGSGKWGFFTRAVRVFTVSKMRSVEEIFGMGYLGKKCTVLETRPAWVLGIYSLQLR